MRAGYHLADLLEVHQGRAVNAQEAVARELGFHSGHGLAQEVGLAGGVQADVVAGGFDPFDLFGG